MMGTYILPMWQFSPLCRKLSDTHTARRNDVYHRVAMRINARAGKLFAAPRTGMSEVQYFWRP